MNRVKFIQDVGEFIVFGTGFWGLITIASILFPIANAITGTISVHEEVVTLATALAVIACVFAFAYSFTEKAHITEFEMRRPFYRGEIINPRRDTLHNSVARFAWGLISLSAYIILNAIQGVLQGNADEVGKWLIPIIQPVSVVFYATAFALVTGAFGSLAVMQHTLLRTGEGRMGSVNLGIRNETRILSDESRLPSSPDGIGDTEQQS